MKRFGREWISKRNQRRTHRGSSQALAGKSVRERFETAEEEIEVNIISLEKKRRPLP
jgi:hypothetical protein